MNSRIRVLLLALSVIAGLLALVSLLDRIPGRRGRARHRGQLRRARKAHPVVNQVLGAGRKYDFDPTGVTGVPRAGAPGVVLAVAG